MRTLAATALLLSALPIDPSLDDGYAPTQAANPQEELRKRFIENEFWYGRVQS